MLSKKYRQIYSERVEVVESAECRSSSTGNTRPSVYASASHLTSSSLYEYINRTTQFCLSTYKVKSDCAVEMEIQQYTWMRLYFRCGTQRGTLSALSFPPIYVYRLLSTLFCLMICTKCILALHSFICDWWRRWIKCDWIKWNAHRSQLWWRIRNINFLASNFVMHIAARQTSVSPPQQPSFSASL